MEKIFQLPKEFIVEPSLEHKPFVIVPGSELARLAIAGFVQTSAALVPREISGYGDPLLLLDGRPYDNESYGDNIAYYGVVYESGRGFSLQGGQWEHMVSGVEGDSGLSVYYGNAAWPSSAPAILFDTPILYDQFEFEKAVIETL